MVKITVDISDEAQIKLLEIQLERKKEKIKPSAINKIASEMLERKLIEESKKEKPEK